MADIPPRLHIPANPNALDDFARQFTEKMSSAVRNLFPIVSTSRDPIVYDMFAAPPDPPRWALIRTGVTRTVLLTPRWAIKWPSRHTLVRGWLANRSEWIQRTRGHVNPPVRSPLHVLSVQRRCPRTGWSTVPKVFTGDEAKPSSWGARNRQWVLIDFDRSWEHPRGIVGGVYFWNQERLGRKWSRLPHDWTTS